MYKNVPNGRYNIFSLACYSNLYFLTFNCTDIYFLKRCFQAMVPLLKVHQLHLMWMVCSSSYNHQSDMLYNLFEKYVLVTFPAPKLFLKDTQS